LITAWPSGNEAVIARATEHQPTTAGNHRRADVKQILEGPLEVQFDDVGIFD
jgi:hypothetical protein